MANWRSSWQAAAVFSIVIELAIGALMVSTRPASPPAAWRPSPYGALSIPLEWAIRCP